MANTLTNLLPDAYAALNTVSRELVGMIPAVTRDATVERAAVNQEVRSPVAPASTASDITPGVTPPNDGDQTIGNVAVKITKARRISIRWQGEETRWLNNGGPGQSSIMRDQFAEAFRTLTNEAEADLAALHAGASRAYGTAGTTPFATAGDYTDASNVLKILLDNGAQSLDRHLVINTAAGANLRGKQGGRGVDAEGSDRILRQGVLLDVHGFAIRESAQIKTPAAGSMTGATVSGAHAVGATAIAVATGAGGSISVSAGDIVTFAGDTNKYVVAAALSLGASASGTLTIAKPGLRKAAAGSEAISVVAAAARNMAFTRDSIVLAHRLPALPPDGDMAVDRQTVQDPVSGLAFEIAMYPQYRQMQYEVSAAWGCGVVKAENLALLLG